MTFQRRSSLFVGVICPNLLSYLGLRSVLVRCAKLKSIFIWGFLIALSFNGFAQPANDDCSNAQFIIIPSSGRICLTIDASTATDDGRASGACPIAGNGKDLWFTFIATGPVGNITVTPSGANPHTNSTVWLSTGTCANLFIESCRQTAGLTPASLNWGLTTGTQYFVSVETNGGNGGTYELCISSTNPPGNPGDDCITAAPICKKSSFSYGNLNGFTASGFQPSCFGSAVQRDIWLKFTVGQTGTLEFMASPKVAQEYDWALFDITNGCPGMEVSCNYYFSQPLSGAEANPIGMMATVPAGLDPGEFNAPVTVTAGRTYALLIDNFSGNNGGFDFEWGGTFQIAPNADFVLSQTTGCNSVTTSFTNNTAGGTQFAWSFGDGTTSALKNPPGKTYNIPGNYIVSLVATDQASGCKSAISQLVTVSKPTVAVVPVPDTICSGGSSILTGSVKTTTLQSPVQFYRALNASITDNNAAGYSSVIPVAGIYPAIVSSTTIESVCIDIEHARDQDLDIFLICPSGTQIELSTDNGANGKNYTQTCFKPTATVNVTAGVAPFTGNFIPEQPFTNLNGCAVNGNWTLKMVDDQSGQVGLINEWSISFKNSNSYTFTWSPTANMTGSATLSPTVSPTNPGTSPLTFPYKLEVTDALGCKADTTVNITVVRVNVGLDDTVSVCENGPKIDLFTRTNDAPAGGRWVNPAGNPFTNPYDPSLHAPGNYLYIAGQSGCQDDTSVMVVKEILLPNAGIDGKDSLCNNTTNGNLFNFITGEPAGGTWKGPGSVNASTGSVNVTTLAPGSYNYLYIVKGTAPCPEDTAIATVVVKALPTASFPAVIPFCKGTTGYLKPVFTGTPPFSLTFTDCGGNSSTVTNLRNGDSIAITPAVSPCLYTITSVSDGGNYSCTNTTTSTRSVTLLTPPVIQLDSLYCNSTNSGYTAHLTLTGGDAPSYTVNGSPSGVKYTSAMIPAGGTYNFTLTDKNGCAPVSTITGFKNCNCTTNAGTMQKSPVNVCGNTAAVAQHNNDHAFDGNDVKVFVLHDNAGITLGTVFAVNKTTPSFTYDPAWGIQYDQTYYISAVVGDAQPGDPAMVDFTNPNGCMSVASGQPVIFHQLPMASAVLSVPQICLGQSADILFSYSAGKEPYDFDLSYQGTSVIPGRTVANNTWSISPTTLGPNTYTLTQVKDVFGCISPLNIPLTLTVVDSPIANSVSTTCNSTNTAYTVSFNITQGDAPSYTVNGAPSASSYTSAFINSGSSYSFTVDDKNRCQPAIVAGSNTCPCITDAGSMAIGQGATPVEFCIYDQAIAAHNSDEVKDGNDVLSFILASDPNNPLTPPYQLNDSAVFSLIAPMVAGTVYYICPIAGDDDGTGLVNLSSTCQDFSVGTPVKFIALPTVSMTGNTAICQGGSATITFTVTGNGTIRFTMNGDDGSSVALQSVAGTYTTTVSPTISNGLVRYSIDPASVFDNTQAVNCQGTWTPPGVDIIVNPTPTATIAAGSNFVICEGEQINIPITTTGNGLLTTVYGYGVGTDSVFTAVAGSYNKPITSTLPPGNYSYVIKSIQDNTPGTCVGTYSGQANVTVRPTPSVSMTLLDDTICRGESSALEFITSGQPTFTIYYHDDSSVNYVKTNLPLGSTVYPITPITSTVFTLDSIRDNTLSDASARACYRVFSGVNQTIVVNQLPTGTLSGDQEICFGQSAYIQFDMNGAVDLTGVYSVVNNQSGFSSLDSIVTSNFKDSVLVSPQDTTTYTLVRIYDNYGCEATNFNGSAYIPVNPIPVPIIAASDTSSCPPLLTTLQNLTDPKYLGSYVWTYGDNTSSVGSGADPGTAKKYDLDGSYTVSLAVTSPQGCFKDTVIPNFLTVYPFPTANFTWEPQPASLIDPLVQFRNLSAGDAENLWQYFTSEGVLLDSSNARNPLYRFPDQDTGTYPVKLWISSPFGCLDSITQTVVVSGVFEVYTPNSFTPNGDGINDVFFPVLLGETPNNYELSIFNRWGEQIFYTTDYKQGWDGIYLGEPCKQDVYVFKLKVRSRYNAEKREIRGQIRLLR